MCCHTAGGDSHVLTTQRAGRRLRPPPGQHCPQLTPPFPPSLPSLQLPSLPPSGVDPGGMS